MEKTQLPNNNNYSITKKGEIYSHFKYGYIQKQNGRGGRLYVMIRKQRYYIDILMAQTYLSNKEGFDFVEHIDGDTSNNDIDNLKWVQTQPKLNTIRKRHNSKQNIPPNLVDIPGYENKYAASKDGKIFSYFSNIFMKQSLNNSNYLTVSLFKRKVSVHRLIAMTFLSNPNNLPVVNHKDGVKTNNNVSNLEWCTNQENCQHAVQENLRPTQISRGCIQMDLMGSEIARYETISEAARATGINQPNISRTCKGRTRKAGGYRWKYIKEDLGNIVSEKDREGWKVIEEFPHYLISPHGDVWSNITMKLLQQRKNSGRWKVNLTDSNIVKCFSVAVLVAKHYIPNPDNLPFVRYLDGNPDHNNVSNLEWCSRSTAINKAYQRKPHSLHRKVKQYDLEGNCIKTFPTLF